VSAVEAPAGTVLLDADALRRTLSRIAHEIIEANPDLTRVALVGIQTRGVPLAHRLRRLIEERAAAAPDLGAVDITFYRDDVQVRSGAAPRHSQPVVRSTALDFPLEGKTVVLVDDVLYTGRTIRAAIEALFDYGRPERIQLAVLVDRGHRELPIRPDYVGKNLPTSRDQRIQVQLVEVDEVDQDGELDAFGPPVVEERLDGRANRAPFVEHVVDEHDGLAFERKVECRRAHDRL
jgi:pyrimidine operon attenuation protein/uracil phosphoribosyltransferase